MAGEGVAVVAIRFPWALFFGVVDESSPAGEVRPTPFSRALRFEWATFRLRLLSASPDSATRAAARLSGS